jgi:hypothetical protein
MGFGRGSPNWETMILRIQGRSFIQNIRKGGENEAVDRCWIDMSVLIDALRKQISRG